MQILYLEQVICFKKMIKCIAKAFNIFLSRSNTQCPKTQTVKIVGGAFEVPLPATDSLDRVASMERENTRCQAPELFALRVVG